LAESIVEKGDAIEGYKALHPTVKHNSARQLVKLRMQVPEVQEHIRELLNISGITIAKLNTTLRNIIEDPSKEVLTKAGEKVSLSDKPTQLAAVQLGYKLHGVDKDNVTIQDNRSITFNSSGAPQEAVESKLGDILARLTELNKRVEEEKFITGEILTSNTAV
jgi:DNA-directed RNA polymerase subunit L